MAIGALSATVQHNADALAALYRRVIHIYEHLGVPHHLEARTIAEVSPDEAFRAPDP
jgi:hypothetical protein